MTPAARTTTAVALDAATAPSLALLGAMLELALKALFFNRWLSLGVAVAVVALS